MNQMQEIYTKIAQENGMTIDEVKHEMQTAIDDAYKNPNSHAMNVKSKGKTPTVEEFIAHIADEVQKEA